MNKGKQDDTYMAEWKTAGCLFGVLALVALCVLLYLKRTQHIIFSYHNCREDYTYTGSVDTLSDDYIYQECEFAKCVSDAYIIHPNKEAANIILKIGSKHVYQLPIDSSSFKRYQCLDSLLKYRKEIFEYKIAWD